MNAEILYGTPVATNLKENIKNTISQLKEKPGLAVVMIGNNSASEVYIKHKEIAAKSCGMKFQLVRLNENASQNEAIEAIVSLNNDKTIHGILVQLPLPPQINESIILNYIDPKKDVDGLHPYNLGKLLIGDKSGFTPCTPLGIMFLLDFYNISVKGKHVVIVGRSNIVGKPLGIMLVQKLEGCNATVTIAHSQSNNLSEITKSADIIIVAVGKKEMLTCDMVSSHAVVIDVGINRVFNENNAPILKGDAAFDDLKYHCKAITPVPGGVGPLTITALLSNTLKAFQNSLKTL